MCGIVGIWNHRTDHAVRREELISMRDTMDHRGPDGSGVWISPDERIGLGHRRLSIVDLDEKASQPMSCSQKRVWVTFNGEIYNHLALRKELESKGHSFRTDHSDTEVLIQGYIAWGIEGLLERIDGMFGFAIWDRERRSLFLVRDRVGIKPVYFALPEGSFLFASEIKALLQHSSISPDIAPRAMSHYLTFLTTAAPTTLFEGIFKLPSGYYLEVRDGGGFSATRYWDALPSSSNSDLDMEKISPAAHEDYYVEQIRKRLEQSVEARMMSDVPIGTFLSGGIDSSTLVALMSRIGGSAVNTFTVGFKDHTHLNEIEYAQKVADHFGTHHHEVLIDESDMMGYLDKLVYHQDEPIADWVCIPLYFVSKMVREAGCKVVLVGEGADEQFCGYAGYMNYLHLYHKYWQPFQRFLPRALQHLTAFGFQALTKLPSQRFQIYADIVSRAARGREHFWSGAVCCWENMKDEILHRDALSMETVPSELIDSGLLPSPYLDGDSFEVVRSFCDRIDKHRPGQDVLTRMIYNEFQLRLPELLLMRVDKITMSTSIEARVPFLDPGMVSFSMDIPMNAKLGGGRYAKHLLKKAVRGWIPDEIIDRPKMGFGAPMEQWMRSDFGREARHRVLSSELMQRD
ncbi:MAG: asparagine synthase (glutamine-hydrolyzing), partial [Planctomycetota bacterium]|nr:asparagine synthase (glutamine-hydrolyzing) [Planctomycetota bacterium]